MCSNNHNLRAILEGREHRASMVRNWVEKFEKTLLVFSLNIPGPNKNIPESAYIMTAGKEALLRVLEESCISIIKKQDLRNAAGPFLILAVDGDANLIKEKVLNLEDKHPVGRLFDIDVFTKHGLPLSRVDLGHSPRKCFLCGETATHCRKSNAHDLDTSLQFIESLVASSI